MHAAGPVTRLASLTLALALVVVAAACTGTAASLRVGDCFDEPAEVQAGQEDFEVTDVDNKQCTEPHDAEVFLVLTHPAERNADYISAADGLGYVQEHCIPAFGDYTGTDYTADEVHDIGYFYPSARSWGSGDRGFTCYIVRVDQGKTTGSLRAEAPPASS